MADVDDVIDEIGLLPCVIKPTDESASPSILPASVTGPATHVALAALRAIDFDFGPTHTEVKLRTPDLRASRWGEAAIRFPTGRDGVVEEVVGEESREWFPSVISLRIKAKPGQV
ncbi:MAG: hypothetical protein M3443_10135, partial [Actinomycetota bacterium]|nr:hypothetical protein [Actinomycetota bacterium]